MNKHEIKISNKIAKYVAANCELIDKTHMRMGNGVFNYRCHLNSVQCLKDDNNDAQEVYACITMDKGTLNNTVCHFINKDSEGYFVDNTLGWEFEQYDYYLIKKIKENECDNIWNVLENIRTSYVDMFCSNLFQKIFKISKYNVL